MQTVPGNPRSVGAQKLVTCRRAITADYIDLPVRLAAEISQVPKQVEEPGVEMVDIPSAMVAKKNVQFRKRLRNIVGALTVNDVQTFPGVRVKEAETMLRGSSWGASLRRAWSGSTRYGC